MAVRQLTPESFWARVDRSGGPDACWPWIAGKFPKGYGCVTVDGRARSAHRIAWELTHGPIPTNSTYHGVCVCHHCDNPPCVNPAHLFLGTHADNVADMGRKGRTSAGAAHWTHVKPERVARGSRNGQRRHPEKTARGERHYLAKLTDADVLTIRASNESVRVLAARFGVSTIAVYKVLRRKTWKHVA